ncbi:ABC transporter ATP-binding protein [Variovorax terrae]|uniref:ABC transporter ATP-binding protein n=1 Tax=Variovorax terrae TaxID=2923278 RepID=A0A9X1VVN1_9BURK|nr:ABC transporter ATP-binding protein [Variovorax terrae]MCJ0764110.1 ABC transporter ATP-binding protein [Variovorax terrae]
MSTPFLSLDKLTLAYGGQVAVPGLDLAMAEGELLALLGPSGCGKTTTMRAIAGLLAPQGGSIHLGGQDITRVPANRREVGLVFQSYALFPHLSVFENVAFGLRLRRVGSDELRRRVLEAIALVGLAGFEKRLPRELSGGQQQRVALARSVVVRPRLLLLDEPLSNLDARLRLEMRSELQRLQRELGVTMMYVTHDQVEALALADRVVVMRAGRIAQQGTPAEIYERPVSAFVAQFVGIENLFRVRDGALAGTAGALAPQGAALPAVHALAWRPRSVVLGQGPYEGRVVGASYLGEAVEYLIDCAAGPLKAQTLPQAPRFALQQNLRFDLPLAEAVHLRED